jgi:hypothetical protein
MFCSSGRIEAEQSVGIVAAEGLGLVLGRYGTPSNFSSRWDIDRVQRRTARESVAKEPKTGIGSLCEEFFRATGRDQAVSIRGLPQLDA